VSRKKKGTGAGVCGQPVGRRLRISLGKYATVLQAEIFAILSCAYEIQMNVRPEKCVTICSDSQVALKAFQASKMSPLVQQCLKVLNDISTQHTVGLSWVPWPAGVRGNEIADKLARDVSFQKFVGPDQSLGVSRQNIRKKIKAGWITIIWQGGKVLVVVRDELEN
jgi:ribonuclease HI